jgi:P27 family predicted phage terminase small subunit
MTNEKFADPPDHISKESKDLWSAYVGTKIHSPGAISLFQEALEALDLCRQAGRLLKDQGLIVTTEKTGTQHVNPAYTVQKESRAQVIKIFKMLNLNVLRF